MPCAQTIIILAKKQVYGRPNISLGQIVRGRNTIRSTFFCPELNYLYGCLVVLFQSRQLVAHVVQNNI